MPPSPPGPRWPRRLLFSLLPVTLLLAGAELGLRAAGWHGSSIAEIQATQGFAHRYYVAQRDRVLGDWFERGRSTDGRAWARSNPALVPRGFHDQNFPIDPPDESLIFALGGSTTQGIPYELEERGFPERLEGLLADTGWQGRPARVINAGVAGMDSSSFPRMAGEAIDLGADALLVYAGNNEIQGLLLRECTDPYGQGLARLGSHSLTMAWARDRWRQLSGWTPPDAPAMVDAQEACLARALDAQRAEAGAGPGAEGPRVDPGYQRLLQGWARNLDAVLTQARRAEVPVWLAVPAVNLRSPPDHGEPPPDLDPAQLRRLEGLLQGARAELEHGHHEQALTHAREALTMAPGHAEALWMAGEALVATGRAVEAQPLHQRAVDHDWLGRRATSDLGALVLERCAAHADVHCVDVAAAFADAASDGIPGDELFVDFCHPERTTGTQLIAEAFHRAMTTDGQ